MLPTTTLRAAEGPERVRIDKTPSGIRYGVLKPLPAPGAPTLLILASTPEETLGSDYMLQGGLFLAPKGYLCVSIDLPCHGPEKRPDEPDGLAGWCHRSDAGEDFAAELQHRASAVLDHLIQLGLTDPSRVAAIGTSRGGYAALQITARDPRFRCVAAMAPVTDLRVLNEFKAAKRPDIAEKLSIAAMAPQLVDRGVWIVIGDRDLRVGTDEAIQLARTLSRLSIEKNSSGNIDLIVQSEPRGHTTPPGAAQLSAEWIHQQLVRKNSAP